MSLTPQSAGNTVAGDTPVTVLPDLRPGTGTALSELVLVDQHEAQGWRVRRNERLDTVFEERCDWIREYGRPGQLAVDADGLSLTYDELEMRANRLARYLRLHGAAAGDRIALLFDQRVEAYVGLLAVLKISGTCVPLDVDAPAERTAYVVADAGARIVLSRSHLRGRVESTEFLRTTGAVLISIDEAAPLIAEMSRNRLQPAERGSHEGRPAYIAYGTGSGGWLEGVGIDHRSIANFARVASEIYGIRGLRLFQGQTPASGGSVAEVWVAWAAGATLVPAPDGAALRGRDLHAFLSAKRVSALSTTPTVLATIEDDLPDLRFLLVSGEACPQSLIARWHRNGRRFLNAYTPSEATVPATWTEVHPDKPVTIGVPLPTYATAVLDPGVPRRALPHGETGELAVAGIGLACGYPEHNALTAAAFVDDFMGIPGNPSGRIYRTGDLGRVNDAGEIEYRGRLDRQVHLRGERVDLTEIESAMLAVPGVAAAAVGAYEPAAGDIELIGYYTLRADTSDLADQMIYSWLRERLAPHHVPARLERLGAIPMTPEGLTDRESLPVPGARGFRPTPVPRTAPVAPSGADEVERLRTENARLLAQLDKLRAQTGAGPVIELSAPAPVAAPAVLLQPPTPVPAPIAAPAPPSSSTTEEALAAVLAEVLDVEQVSVDSHFFDDLGADSMVMARFCARLRKRDDLPTVSIKQIYAQPTIRGLVAAFAPAAPAPAAPAAPAVPAAPAPTAAPVAAGLAAVLAEVLDVEQVSVDSHFFDDLGADSMVMARFCARLRKRDDLPTVSMKDVYAQPTLRGLATALGDGLPAPAQPSAPAPTETRPTAECASASTGTPPATEVVKPATTREYVLCAVLQALIFLGYSYLAATIFEQSFQWISLGQGLLDYYVRAVEVGAVTFAIVCTLPILLKWVLIGRWKPQRQIRIWSLGYVRFWAVKTLVASNPLVLLAGSPLYNVYLRALGAKIGRGAVILSRHAPACPDLLTIGAGTVIRKEAYFNCYRAHAGVIQTGTVTLGNDVFVGEKAILDIGTSIGDGAQLGHTSSLHAGQSVPAGEHWHGSPGQRTDADYRGVETTHLSNRRRVGYSVMELLSLVFLVLPLVFGGVAALLGEVPWLAALLESGPRALTDWTFYAVALVTSLVLFFGSKLLALLLVFTVPRVLNLMLKPDRTYPLYGFYYSVHKTIVRLSNRKFFHELFGDSSAIAHYVRRLGYKLASPLVQTGSNFGVEVKHENPFLVSVGSGTVIASGHTFINADYSSTSFRISRTSVGANNFLGNDIVYPPQGRTGADCLLATKVLVPIDGKVREGVGLLGSPAFEIPRTVARDSKFAQIAHGEDFPRLLAAKNKYNRATMGWLLLVRWFYYFVLTLTSFMTVDLYDTLGAWSIVMLNVAVLVFSVFYFALVERASTRFRGLRPSYCSIYQIDFWRTERFFKFCARIGLHRIFNGTPYKAMLFRMVGVNIGKRLFDDGASMAEKNLVTLGDDVTLNAGSVLQCHSQEDYAFKSDRITVGSGATIGVGAFVHYGVTIGDSAVLAPDSFLMKGEEISAHERWGGNPAEEMAPFGPLDVQVSRAAGKHRALEMGG
jgi:non-ribosomal peptide synthetase-like protein